MSLLKRALAGCVLLLTALATLGGGWGDIGAAVADQLVARSPAEAGAGTIRGSVLTSTDRLSLPTRIMVHGDELLVIDRYARTGLISLDRRSGDVRRVFGPRGEGPRELAGPTAILGNGPRAGVYDARLNRLIWLDSQAPAGSFEPSSIVTLQLESAAVELQPTASGALLAAGFFGPSRLHLLDADGRPTRPVGHLDIDPSLPVERQTELYQGTLRATEGRDRFVLTSRFASRVQVWDEDLGESETIWGPDHFEPSTGRYVSRFGYLDSAPSGSGFFALYSGRTREDFPGRANFGNEIHEFTWDGHLIGRYSIDSDLISIAWHDGERLLYGIRHDPEPGVVVYELPPAHDSSPETVVLTKGPDSDEGDRGREVSPGGG